MRVFLSDLHLEDPESPAFHGLRFILTEVCRDAEEIFILGDLTEVWVGDDDDGPLANALRELLADASRRADLFIMRGNRDFLFGAQFCSDTGATLLEDPTLLDDGTLIAHGDAFCIEDTDYQQMRTLLRSESWQTQILAQSLEARRELADNLRTESRQASANKPGNIMDVTDSEVARVVRESGARRLIHGHTHRPGVHACAWGPRYVLGAWERCGWIASQLNPGDNPELSCFSLAARCET